ncbi:putative glycine-rich cell wall structural protein 1 isoform X2 [Coccinella septempunctata]|uniref:putative glycine-rich cell wall structural protein 1 isoform X2 n=1 Tax=Coccinella septempunctata TaxID=41139 RepID=UPI001D097C6E|nr:putative glycine-rich cell wall structural protein 1 isoform X2 [Coccinella septempunctata]
MNRFSVALAFALAAVVVAEPPSGYNYNRPSGGGGFGGGLGGGLSGGGGYTAVSSGYQTSEGASVDPALLEQVRQILLKEEQNTQSVGGGIGGGFGGGISSSYGAPSQQYGVPSSSYGVPSYNTRVVGIDLEGIKQAIQVAQYNQVSQAPGFSGYPSGPSRPSGSYGAPY